MVVSLVYCRDYTFDFQSARDGLLTLENAFFELMDGVPDDSGKDTTGGKEILEDKAKRDDIELESIDNKNILGLWNSPESRAVFYEIVNSEWCSACLLPCCCTSLQICVLQVARPLVFLRSPSTCSVGTQQPS